MTALGFDFGTTNTVLAAKAGDTTRSLSFTSNAEVTESLRTCLSFMKDKDLGGLALKVEAGAAAISSFIENPGECRFLQSIKTFAASPLFQSTIVHARRHSFEDLLEIFTRRMMAYSGDGWPSDVTRIVAGRPVRFAGMNADADLAMERYRTALARFGFPDVQFVMEPVAAAFYFAQNLERDTNVLVADFGGGTTDYSIIRFEKVAGKVKAQPVAHGGVGIAGDMFDFRIIDNVVSPQIGKGGYFRNFGKRLEIPSNYYANFGRWNQLSIFKTLRDFQDLKSLVRQAEDPDQLELFVDLIEHDEGYPLYQAISKTKFALSSQEEAEFHFEPLGRSGDRVVKRSDFESWIAPDIALMEKALDETLAEANMPESEVGAVFLTGGTSFVPAVRNLFSRRFGAERIQGGGELLSIAHGLALIGERDDIADWVS